MVEAAVDSNNNPIAFTGGWHGYNGELKGSPTARTDSVEVYADDSLITHYANMKYNTLKIYVTNSLQGYNTTKPNGTGRYILKECVVYTINKASINVAVEITALEDIVIRKYYGLQTQNTAWTDSIEYIDVNGRCIGRFMGMEESKVNGYPQKIILKGKNNILTAWLDTNNGLGKREYVSDSRPQAFTLKYGKSYFSLVNGMYVKLKCGEKLNWAGGYIFKQITQSRQ